MKIIHLIIDNNKKHSLIPAEYKYLLGYCYVNIGEFSKAKPLLNSLYYDKSTFSDIPYLLAVIEFKIEKSNIHKIIELIKIAESFNNDCEELRHK